MNILPAFMVLDWYILLKNKPVYIDLAKKRVQEDEKKTICMHIHIHGQHDYSLYRSFSIEHTYRINLMHRHIIWALCARLNNSDHLICVKVSDAAFIVGLSLLLWINMFISFWFVFRIVRMAKLLVLLLSFLFLHLSRRVLHFVLSSSS